MEWIKEELEAGAWKVITEAREGGTAGIFRQDGEMRTGLIDEIAHGVSIDDLIFEAPTKASQAWFVKHFGPNVNLGNIPPDEVIPLETLRLGLRGTDRLEEVVAFYRDGVGLTELGRFEAHSGYDGVMLGLPGSDYHLEFTSHHDGSPCPAPSVDNLLVLYLESEQAAEIVSGRLADMGYRDVEPEPLLGWSQHHDPDPDGWRLVLDWGLAED